MASFCGLLLLSLVAMVMAMAGATQFRVGGSMGWAVPADQNAMSFNQWAEKNRFRVGDSLLFVYPPDRDSVLQVDRNAYLSCNTSSYIGKFDGGNTVFAFSASGPFYFISGVEQNCIRKESMVVAVMADRSRPSTSPPPPSPMSPESPSPTTPPPPPAPASSGEVPPSPAPSGESSPSPPPPPPPNGGSAKAAGFIMGSVGAAIELLLFVL